MIKAEEAAERTRTSGGTYLQSIVKKAIEGAEERIKIASRQGRYDVTLNRDSHPEVFGSDEALGELVDRLRESGYRVRKDRMPATDSRVVVDYLEIDWKPRRQTWVQRLLNTR